MNKAIQNLGTPAALRQFLCELANLNLEVVQRLGIAGNAMLDVPAGFEEAREHGRIGEGEEKAFRKFMERFRMMLPSEIAFEEKEGRSARRLKRLQEWVHVAWKEPDPRARLYRIFRILDGLHKLYEHPRLFGNDDSSSLDSFTVPGQTLFERALLQLNRTPDLAKFCLNPDCPAPYFFANRRSQKYCSNVCGAPAQREAKLRYWKSKGKSRIQAQGKLKRRSTQRS